MYPVVIGNGRNLQSDAIINGFHVPKGVNSSRNENCSYYPIIITILLCTFPTDARDISASCGI